MISRERRTRRGGRKIPLARFVLQRLRCGGPCDGCDERPGASLCSGQRLVTRQQCRLKSNGRDIKAPL
jgi:hypothetical protein